MKINYLKLILLSMQLQNNIFCAEVEDLKVDVESKLDDEARRLASTRSRATTNTETPSSAMSQQNQSMHSPLTPVKEEDDKVVKKISAQRTTSTPPNSSPGSQIKRLNKRRLQSSPALIDDSDKALQEFQMRTRLECDRTIMRESKLKVFEYLQHCGQWDLQIPDYIDNNDIQTLREELKQTWKRNLKFVKKDQNLFKLIFKFDENGKNIENITNAEMRALLVATLLFSPDDKKIFNKEYYKLAQKMAQEDPGCNCTIL